MKLAEMDVDVLITALGWERSRWIALKTEENRQLTESEKVTVCVLSALEHALKRATGKL
jgi:hypothetical protein